MFFKPGTPDCVHQIWSDYIHLMEFLNEDKCVVVVLDNDTYNKEKED